MCFTIIELGNCQQFIELQIYGANSEMLLINRTNIFDDEAPLRIEVLGDDSNEARSNVTMLLSTSSTTEGKIFCNLD